MTEYIEREAAVQEVMAGKWRDGADRVTATWTVAAAPGTDAAPVRHGRWIDRYGGRYENALHECSECKTCALYKPERDVLGSVRFVQELSEYCPHCGARMDGGGGND